MISNRDIQSGVSTGKVARDDFREASNSLNTVPLTGLRFFAALGVYIFHFPFVSQYPYGLPSFGIGGYACVTFFFTLSGLILTITYRDYHWSKASFRDYLVKRMARIAPLYYLSLIIALPMFLLILREAIVERGALNTVHWIALHSLLLTWLEPASAFKLYLNPPVWSLSVEVVFYFLFPFLLLTAIRINKIQHGIQLSLLFVLAIYFVKEIVFRQITQSLNSAQITTTTHVFVTNPFLRSPEFIVGILLGFLTHHIVLKKSLGNMLFAFSLACLVGSTQFSGYVQYCASYLAIIGVICSSMIVSGRWNQFLSHPTVQMLGRASFALYLIHYPMTMSVQLLSRKLLGAELPVALVCGACIWLSVILHKRFETVMRNRLVAKFARAAYVA